MRPLKPVLSLAAVLVAANAPALDVTLFEWAVNRDGVITGTGDPLPPGSVFDTTTGLGTIKLTYASAGVHYGIVFVDHELSEADNTFFNELGLAFGAPTAGLSWEIDEPGFSPSPGDIFDNFLANTLDNAVGKGDPDDVSLALGFNLILAPDEAATLTFSVTETAPSGFYLRHFDPDSDEEIFFSAVLDFHGTQPPGVPEGGSSLALLLAAGGALAGLRARRAN
jgi:hypothetical protein